MFAFTKGQAYHFYILTHKRKHSFAEKLTIYFSSWASVQAAENNLIES